MSDKTYTCIQCFFSAPFEKFCFRDAHESLSVTDEGETQLESLVRSMAIDCITLHIRMRIACEMKFGTRDKEMLVQKLTHFLMQKSHSDMVSVTQGHCPNCEHEFFQASLTVSTLVLQERLH